MANSCLLIWMLHNQSTAQESGVFDASYISFSDALLNNGTPYSLIVEN